MKIGKQARREAKELFNVCRVNGVLDENRVRQAVRQVGAQRPRGFAAILSHFHRLVKLDLARRAAKVESAVALSEPLRASVETSLARRYGRGLTVVFAPNAQLIGGLRVQVGSDVYDGSVKARLDALTERF
jgi:F-type H+-transporting ATPase subunit delta